VKDNLLFGQRFRPENAPDELFNEIVDMLEISGLLNSRPRRISGGEAQRVALGRALLSSPELLLLDEPFSAVDAALRKNILPFLWRIRSRLHIPMLIISHDLPDLLQLTSVLLLINKGKVTGHGKIEDLVFKENLFSLVKASGMVSVLDLIVTGREGRDTLVLKDKTGDSLFYAVCREGEVSEKTEIKASIAPEDIILSKKPVYDTSARNVIAGKVSRILDSPGQSLCQIDIGGSNCILAELTKGSFNQINPKPGEQLYCIFKATALDLTFLGK
jgi:molybdate transport system ATP-binding protein